MADQTHVKTEGLTRLRSAFRGELIEPGHPAYEGERRIYNAMIDRRPALIAQCRDAADVRAAVAYGRGAGLPVSIRGGGHNGAGLAVCDGGVMIDLSRMKGIRADPWSRQVRVEPGCTQGDVDHATHTFGLAVPSGTVANTGVAGLTLGGGHGYLVRRWGLTIDNLLEADVVLANGEMVRASEQENADLFWALRGGGGNFGVVTSFLFRAHPVSTVVAGPMMWPLDQTTDILRWYRDYHPSAPETLYGFPAMLRVPPAPFFPSELHGTQVCAIVWCCSGDVEEGMCLMDEIRRMLPKPLIDMVGPMPFPALQGMFDPLIPPGLQWYWKGAFFDELPDEAIAIHRRFGEKIPMGVSTMHLYPIDGAASRIPSEATAFSYREAKWSMVIAGIHPEASGADEVRRWAQAYWEELHPYSLGGSYVNFLMEEGIERVQATYRDNYARLQAVKAKYDPENLFHLNQNIRPAKSTATAEH